MSEENLKIIEELAGALIKGLEVEASISVEKKEDAFYVQIEAEDTGILIGYHGETLASFQLMLSLLLYKKIGSWSRIVVNVGDWRQRREEVLRQMAQSAAEKVIASGQPTAFPSLSSFERRIIHLALTDHPQVQTVSEGEGAERKLIIKPRENS